MASRPPVVFRLARVLCRGSTVCGMRPYRLQHENMTGRNNDGARNGHGGRPATRTVELTLTTSARLSRTPSCPRDASLGLRGRRRRTSPPRRHRCRGDRDRRAAVYTSNSRSCCSSWPTPPPGAQDVGADVWQFSVELSALRRAGLTTNECRWLVAKGLARHAREVTAPDTDRRVFQNYSNLALSKRTCFVIAERGIVYANALLRSQPRRRATDATIRTLVNRRRPTAESNGHAGTLTPTWDSDRQQLRVGRVIVKEFKVPAANQEAILAAFQEEGWVPRIDDPVGPAVESGFQAAPARHDQLAQSQPEARRSSASWATAKARASAGSSRTIRRRRAADEARGLRQTEPMARPRL